MKVYVIFLPNMLKTKMNLFHKYEHKVKLNFFSHDNLKINLEPRS